jgi:crossover junction endodeoxyribonuclease RuvC
MIILGIDPGLATTGYAVIKTQNTKDDLKVIDYGVISTKAGLADSDRLVEIADGIEKLIEMNQPDKVAVESLFFCNNQKTAMKVGQARGVVMLVCKRSGLEFVEFTPRQVKQAVVGYGMADKKQVQYMVKNIYNLSEIPKPDDAADALALCFACASSK